MFSYLHKLWLFVLLSGGVLYSTHAAYAACTPGIPCVDYDRENPEDANTDPTFNGPKTGRLKNTASSVDYLNSFVSSPSTPFEASDSELSPDYENGACDGNFMNIIHARAFMEANREMIMAQQIIHRPDSVIEYTCFDHLIGGAAQHIAPILTESQAWKDREIELWADDNDTTTTINDTPQNYVDPVNQDSHSVFTDLRMDATVTQVVIPVLQNYIEDQYPGTYQSSSLSINNSFMRSRLGSLVLNDYACTEMYSVWHLSKCSDFGEEDRFRSFSHLVDFDPRTTPVSCSASGHESNDSVGASVGTGDKIDQRTGTTFSVAGTTFDIGSYAPFNSKSDTDGDGDIDSSDSAISEACPPEGGEVSGVSTKYSNNMIRVANNCDKTDSSGDEILDAYAKFDHLKTYMDQIRGAAGLYLPGVGTEEGVIYECGPPVPTGILVATYEHEYENNSSALDHADRDTYFHLEFLCTNPGCVYVPVKAGPFPSNLPVSNIINLTGSNTSIFDIDTDDFAVVPDGECVPLGTVSGFIP